MGAASAVGTSPTVERLESQIAWYDSESKFNKRWYEILKAVELVSAAAVPLAIATLSERWIPAALGVIVVVLEGVLQLKQFHSNWISYRSTSEALKHEKFLFLGNAGPYAGATDNLPLLAARVEELVSREHAKWVDTRLAQIKPP